MANAITPEDINIQETELLEELSQKNNYEND